jgi:PhzF family phenazine biosynthesis protein
MGPSGTLDSMKRPFQQIDVFSPTPYLGNPVAVVLDADDLSDDQMQVIARWTNLSETSFLLAPTSSEADYRVRIFTPVRELPFAGHPTLGSAHAWLSTQASATRETLTQECQAGLVRLRRIDGRLAFAGPPLVRSGPVDAALAGHIAEVLRIDRSRIVDAEWVDNGPGWVAVLLESADEVLALEPGFIDLDLGVIGPYPAGSPIAIEVRGFFPKDGATAEDPVTGSLNASIAPWLFRTGRVARNYVASQGTVLGREGRAHISIDDDGTVWVAGDTITCIEGTIQVET